MKKLFTLFVALLGYMTIQAQECTELFPGLNLHPDWQMTDLELYVGWGGPKTLIDANLEPDFVYCGNSSIAVGSISGGACSGSVDVIIPMKPNTTYRVRAMVFVDTRRFCIGGLNLGPIVWTTKTKEWEQIDAVFKTGNRNNYDGLFFNNCEGADGNIAYIDNWELYEWPDLVLVDMIRTLYSKANSLYDAEKAGAQAMKDAAEAAEALLSTLSAVNVEAQNIALEKAAEALKEAIANFVEPYVAFEMDYTFVVSNPTFETSFGGWISTTGAQNNQLQTNGWASNPDGNNRFWENWHPDPFTGQMYQVVTGLPNGNYTLKAAAFRNQDSNDVYLYAADSEAVMTRITTQTLTYHTLNCVVSNNALEIGLVIEYATTNWVGIDNVQLTYWGNSLNALKGILAKAETNAAEPMEASVAIKLAAAIEEAKAAIASQNPADIILAIDNLSAANEAAERAIAIYAPLKKMIDRIYDEEAQYAEFSGYAAFIVVLEAIEEDCFRGAYLNADEVQQAMDILRASEIACRITNPDTPADFTFAIWNPSFEEGQSDNLISANGQLKLPAYWELDSETELDGWNDVMIVDISHNRDVPHEGKFMYNVWASSVNYFNLYQEVTLPNGEYTLEAVMRTGGAGDVINQFIYAEIDGIKYPSEQLTFKEGIDWHTLEGWVPLSVDFELPKLASVIIGVESDGGWFQVDDFRLTRLSSVNSIKPVHPDKGFSAFGIKNGIRVKSNSATRINVYSVVGQLIRSVEAGKGETFIPVAAGVYIVNKTKVIVK